MSKKGGKAIESRKEKRNKGMKENIRRSPPDFKQGLEFV